MEQFSDRLKNLRKDRKISLQTLAKASRLSKSSISRWEKGQADIKGSQLILLAKYFKVSTDYLLGLED